MTTPRLYGLTELSAALGWDRRKAAVYLQRKRLPEPAVRLACGPIWTGEQVDALLRSRQEAAQPKEPEDYRHAKPGRRFLHREWKWNHAEPRTCVVLEAGAKGVRWAVLTRVGRPASRSHMEAWADFAGSFGSWVPEAPERAAAAR